jgi:hypothetical protein
LAPVSGNDWEAVSTVVTNRSLRTSRKMIKSFELCCNFSFLWSTICKQAGVM